MRTLTASSNFVGRSTQVADVGAFQDPIHVRAARRCIASMTGPYDKRPPRRRRRRRPGRPAVLDDDGLPGHVADVAKTGQDVRQRRRAAPHQPDARRACVHGRRAYGGRRERRQSEN
jgi:hypothetical protein